MSSTMMKLMINGKQMEIPEGTTIADFLARHNLQPKSVVVEVNKVIIEREKYGDTTLKEGDTVEIVRFIGGG